MRKQGEPPGKDPHSFAQFTCDLCNTPHPISDSGNVYSAGGGHAKPAGKMSIIPAGPVPGS